MISYYFAFCIALHFFFNNVRTFLFLWVLCRCGEPSTVRELVTAWNFGIGQITNVLADFLAAFLNDEEVEKAYPCCEWQCAVMRPAIRELAQ